MHTILCSKWIRWLYAFIRRVNIIFPLSLSLYHSIPIILSMRYIYYVRKLMCSCLTEKFKMVHGNRIIIGIVMVDINLIYWLQDFFFHFFLFKQGLHLSWNKMPDKTTGKSVYFCFIIMMKNDDDVRYP